MFLCILPLILYSLYIILHIVRSYFVTLLRIIPYIFYSNAFYLKKLNIIYKMLKRKIFLVIRMDNTESDTHLDLPFQKLLS